MESDLESCVIPINEGIVNTYVGGNGGTTSVSIGIDSVGEKDHVVVDGSHREKETHAWEFNAGSISDSIMMESRSCTW